MAKMKPLLPTLKEKKRYIAFEVLAERDVPFKDAREALAASALEMFGITGTAHMGLWIFPEKYKNNKGILRITHTYQHQARAALALVRKAGEQACVMRSLRASGVLAKALLAQSHMTTS
jgi:ribonuclease P/MRP protein subunit POP5